MEKLTSFLWARREVFSKHGRQALPQFDAANLPKFTDLEKKEIQRTLDIPQVNTDPIALIFETLDAFADIPVSEQTLKEMSAHDENEDEEVHLDHQSFESLRATVRIRKLTQSTGLSNAVHNNAAQGKAAAAKPSASASTPAAVNSTVTSLKAISALNRNPEPWEINIVAVERGLFKPLASRSPTTRPDSSTSSSPFTSSTSAKNIEALVFQLPHLVPRPRPLDPEWKLMPPLPPGMANLGRTPVRPGMNLSSGAVPILVPPPSPATGKSPSLGSSPGAALAVPPSPLASSPAQDPTLLRARAAAVPAATLSTSLADSMGSDSEKKEKKHGKSRGKETKSSKKEEKEKEKEKKGKNEKKDAKESKNEKNEKHVHRFVRYHFQGPRKCAICEELVWGAGKQGYYCHTCDSGVHGTCLRAVD